MVLVQWVSKMWIYLFSTRTADLRGDAEKVRWRRGYFLLVWSLDSWILWVVLSVIFLDMYCNFGFDNLQFIWSMKSEWDIQTRGFSGFCSASHGEHFYDLHHVKNFVVPEGFENRSFVIQVIQVWMLQLGDVGRVSSSLLVFASFFGLNPLGKNRKDYRVRSWNFFYRIYPSCHVEFDRYNCSRTAAYFLWKEIQDLVIAKTFCLETPWKNSIGGNPDFSNKFVGNCSFLRWIVRKSSLFLTFVGLELVEDSVAFIELEGLFFLQTKIVVANYPIGDVEICGSFGKIHLQISGHPSALSRSSLISVSCLIMYALLFQSFFSLGFWALSFTSLCLLTHTAGVALGHLQGSFGFVIGGILRDDVSSPPPESPAGSASWFVQQLVFSTCRLLLWVVRVDGIVSFDWFLGFNIGSYIYHHQQFWVFQPTTHLKIICNLSLGVVMLVTSGFVRKIEQVVFVLSSVILVLS